MIALRRSSLFFSLSFFIFFSLFFVFFPLLSLCQSTTPSPPPSSIINFIISRYGSGSIVESIRSRMPSRSGSTDQFNSDDKQYYEGIAKLAIPGILFAALSFLILIIYSCYRCCCASKKPSGPPPSKKIIIAAGLLFIISFVFIIVGLAYNEKTTEAISRDNGIVDNGKGLLSDTIRITSVIDNNLITVQNETQAVSPNLQSRLNTILTAMSNGINGVDTALISTSNTINYYSSIIIQPYDPNDPNFNQPITYSCGSVCSGAYNEVISYKNAIDNNVNPLYNNIQYNLIPSIRQNIIDSQTTIITSIQSALSTVRDVNRQAVSHQGTTNDVADETNKGDTNRRWAMIVLFIIPLITTLLLMIGLLKKYHPLIKFNRIVLSFFVPLLFLTFGTHMALTALTADSCVYFDKKEITLRSSFNQDTAAVIESCLVGSSIIEALNINDPINDINNITIPTFPDASILLNTDQWIRIRNQTDLLTLSSFGFNPSFINDALNALNTLTSPDTFTINTAINCDYNAYPGKESQVRTAKNRLLTLINAQNQLNQSINDIKKNATTINNALTNAINTVSMVQSLISSLTGVLTPLLNAGYQLKNAAYCTVLGNRYLIIKQKLCGSQSYPDTDKESIALSVGVLTIACLFIAVSSFSLIAIAIKVESSLGNNDRGEGKNEEEIASSAGLNPLQNGEETSHV